MSAACRLTHRLPTMHRIYQVDKKGHDRSYLVRLANRFGRSKNVTIAAEKVSTCFAQPGELVVPPFEVFGRKLILAPHKIPDETCQTFAVSVIVPLEIEDWEDGRIIEPKTCTDQAIGQ